MSKCMLATFVVAAIPATFLAQTTIETCEGLPVALTVDVPTELVADSAQWYHNSNPSGPLELGPTTSTWYNASVGIDDSGLYEYIIWYTDTENQVQELILAAWQVTIWEGLSLTSVADTFGLCALGDTELELGALDGGSGNFEWNWTAVGPIGTFEVDLPASLSQTFGPEADSAQWQVTIVDLEGCGSISSPTWVFETQDPLSMALGVADGNGANGSWCHGQPVELSGTPGYAAYHWTFVDESGSTETSTDVPSWTTPDLTSASTVSVQATNSAGCLSASEAITLSVLDAIEAPVIPDLAPICYDGSTILFLEQEPTPSELTWVYSWIDAEGMEFGAGNSVPVNNLISDFDFYVEATSVEGCGSLTTPVATQPVFQALAPPLIVHSSAEFPDTACFGASDFELIIAEEAAPDMAFTYQWYVNGEPIGEANGGTMVPFSIAALTAEVEVFVEATSIEGCGQATSATLVQAVFPELIPPVIAPSIEFSADTLCFGTTGFTIEEIVPAAPDMTFAYTWFVDGLEVMDENEATYVMPALEASPTIVLEVTSLNGCGTFPSNEVEVYVFEEVQAGSILPYDSPICNAFDGNLGATAEVSGENIYYQWETSTNGANWSSLPDGVGLELLLPDLTETGFYRLRYLSEDGCASDVTPSVELEVLPQLQAPVIGSSGSDEAFCYGSVGPSFQVNSPATGGNESFNNLWQFSSDGSVWSNVSALASYTPNPVTQSGYYRLNSTSTFGCGSTASEAISVTVLPAITPSIISGAQTLCFMELGTDLVGNSTTGADGNFSYQWVATTDGQSTPVVGAENITLAVNGLEATTTFVLQATSTYGCGVVESNPIEVFVWDELLPGSLLPVLDTVCFGWDLAIEATPVTSGQNITTQWHLGYDSEVLSESPEQAADLTWNLEALESSLYYAVSYTSDNGCGTVWSDTALVTVLPAVIHPVIAMETIGADSICYNTVPSQFLQTGASTGANNDFSYLWQIQIDGSSSWTSINNASNDMLSLPAQTQGFTVRQIANDELCGAFHSNEIAVHVFAPFVPATLQGEQLICYGSAPADLVAVGPTGGGGDYLYEWFVVSNVDTLLVPEENNPTLSVPEMFEDTTYLLETSSSYGCGTGWSNAVEIQVADSLIAGSFVVNPLGELCANESVNATGTDATGGIGVNGWTWWMGTEGLWDAVGSELNLSPIQLSDTVLLTLTFSNECGTVSADTSTVIVNPLPPLESITGDLNPCASSVANYLSIGSYNPAIDYSWTSNSSSIEITSGESGPAILYNHTASSTPVQFEVTLEYTATGCISDSIFTITPSLTEAPPLGFVEQKPGLDVLVCSDSTDCAQYQWGILNPETNSIFWIPGETDQYLYYEGLESEEGVFCVEVTYDCGDGEVSCPTLMYWNYTPFLAVDGAKHPDVLVFPNPFKSAFNLSGATAKHWFLFDNYGRLVCQEGMSNNVWRPRVNLDRGSYILVVQTDLGLIKQVVLKL